MAIHYEIFYASQWTIIKRSQALLLLFVYTLLQVFCTAAVTIMLFHGLHPMQRNRFSARLWMYDSMYLMQTRPNNLGLLRNEHFSVWTERNTDKCWCGILPGILRLCVICQHIFHVHFIQEQDLVRIHRYAQSNTHFKCSTYIFIAYLTAYVRGQGVLNTVIWILRF